MPGVQLSLIEPLRLGWNQNAGEGVKMLHEVRADQPVLVADP